MQEKSWFTTVIGIGKEGHRLMHEVQSRMVCENSDDLIDYRNIELCHYWELPLCNSMDEKELEHNCRNAAFIFLLADVYDENYIKYAREIGKFVNTHSCTVSIVLLSRADSLQINNVASQLFPDVDAIVDLNQCTVTGEVEPPDRAYNIIRGLNSLFAKPGLIGLDAVDTNKQLHKAGLLHVGFGNIETDHDDEAMATATKEALSQIKCANAKRVVLCFEGKAYTLSMIDICSSVETVAKAMPNADILYGATESKSIGNMTRALIVVSDL